jgi:hypothetical protein
MERGENVPAESSRELAASEITALPEDLRATLIESGVVYSGKLMGYYYGMTDEGPSGYIRPASGDTDSPLSHDSDTLDASDVSRVVRAAYDACRAALKRKQNEIEANRARKAEAIADYRRRLAEFYARPVMEIVALDIPTPPSSTSASEDKVIREEFAEAERARKMERPRLDEEKKRAANADCLAWIDQHGSNRLKALVHEGISYDRDYRDERLALERPGWVWMSRVCGDLEEIEGVHVTDALIADLYAVRTNRVADAKIAWLGEGTHHDDCGCPREDDETTGESVPAVHQRPVLRATFLGREIVREFEIVEKSQEITPAE